MEIRLDGLARVVLNQRGSRVDARKTNQQVDGRRYGLGEVV